MFSVVNFLSHSGSRRPSLTIFLFSAMLLSACSSKVFEPSDADINAEAAKAYREVKAKSKVSTNKQWNEMLDRVASRIAHASKENFQWEYVLIESKEVNAWCMPGGKIAVYTGIMPVLKTEAALAAVLGHEVAHATLRHGKAGYARAVKGQLIGVGVAVAAAVGGELFCKSESCKTMANVGGSAAGLAVTFFERKYSRKDESAADYQGQIYMAEAGYDPSEAARVWDRMAKAGGGSPPEFLSTHPSNERRKSDLITWLPEANRRYQAVQKKYGMGEPIN